MAEFLALRIISGKLSIEEIPQKLKTQVEEILINKGFTNEREE